MLARPEVVSHPSQEQGSQFPEVHPWRSVHCHAGSEPGAQKTANFRAKSHIPSSWTTPRFLECDSQKPRSGRGLGLGEEHLKMLKPFTCWVLSIIARASAISFWFTPQRFATFVWHLWWTFMPHAERQNTRGQDNEGCKGLGRNKCCCWPKADSHLNSSWDATQVVFWFPMETIFVFSSGQRLHFHIHQPLQVQGTKLQAIISEINCNHRRGSSHWFGIMKRVKCLGSDRGNRTCKFILGVIWEDQHCQHQLWCSLSLWETTHDPSGSNIPQYMDNCPHSWSIILHEGQSCRPLLHPPGCHLILVLQRRAINEIWIFRLPPSKDNDPSCAQLVSPSPGTHHHTSAPAVPAPRGGCHSAHRRWGSCSCRLWSGGACRSWTSPCGTARQKPGWESTPHFHPRSVCKTKHEPQKLVCLLPLILGFDWRGETVYQAHNPKFWYLVTPIQRELGRFIPGLDQRTACALFTYPGSPDAQWENTDTFKNYSPHL